MWTMKVNCIPCKWTFKRSPFSMNCKYTVTVNYISHELLVHCCSVLFSMNWKRFFTVNNISTSCWCTVVLLCIICNELKPKVMVNFFFHELWVPCYSVIFFMNFKWTFTLKHFPLNVCELIQNEISYEIKATVTTNIFYEMHVNSSGKLFFMKVSVALTVSSHEHVSPRWLLDFLRHFCRLQ